MIRISEIDLTKTEKGDCINCAITESGLPEDVVRSYFDSMYRDMVATSTNKVTWKDVLEIFRKNLSGASGVAENPSVDLLKDIQNSNDIILNLKKMCVLCEAITGHNLTNDTNLDTDIRDCYMGSKDFGKVLGRDQKILANLGESAVDKAPVLTGLNDFDAGTIGVEERKEMFDTMSQTLANYHKYTIQIPGINSTFNVIKEFIDKQLDEISNDKYITQRDNDVFEDFINQLYHGEHIPPHFASIDYLRTFVSDFTHLLMYIVNCNDKYLKYLGDKFNNFVNTENLINYKKVHKMIVTEFNDYIEYTDPYETDSGIIDRNLPNINVEHNISCVLGSLNIINNIRGEFNLGIRKIINSYITHTTNLVTTYKNAYLRISKYQQL